MEVPASVYDPSWAYIYTEERPETGIIQKVEYSDTSQVAGGEDTVILSGFFFEWELNRYTFLVEQTEEEAYRYYKPSPARKSPPKLYQGNDGNLYQEPYGGGLYDMSGEYVAPSYSDPYESLGLVEVELGLGAGATEIMFETNNLEKFPSGKWGSGEYTKDGYAYYTEDGGKLRVVDTSGDGAGTETEYEMVGFGPGTSSQAIYKDADGNYKWVAGVVSQVDGSYERSLDAWQNEVKTEGLEVVQGDGTIMGGSTYAIKHRTVKGPWQLRTDLDVNEPADNVQRVIQWAQDIWGNNILYDEPGFEGESKIIDPSLRLFGDLAYEELKTIEASPRMSYSFESDTCVFEVWRGIDRTQSQTDNPFAVFSDTWGTLYGFTASKDVSNYRNTCYVLYNFREQIDADGNQIGPRGYVVARLEDELPDRETYLDLRGEEPESDDQTDEAFIESLRQRGLAHLKANYAIIENLDTGTLVQDGYLSGFDLGDKVDMLVESVGLVKEARITGVCEIHEAGSSTVSIEIGEQKLTEIRKAVIA
ncbi:MAG: hypothetical protein IJW29_06165 [Clostridia bacterium]|nr:hypothetical protein [Clostridia bacterium]